MGLEIIGGNSLNLGPRRSGLRFLNNGGGSTYVPFISPTIGNSIVADGNMEAAGVTSWGALVTPPTREKSGTQKHDGTQSLHIVADENSEGAQQWPTAVIGQWYLTSAWGFVVSGSMLVTAPFGFGFSKTFTEASWQQLLVTEPSGGTGPRFQCRSINASEFYMDDVAMQPLTLATCFANPRTGTALDTVSAKVTGAGMCKIGVVANLDSMTNPSNYVLAVVDKENSKVWLYQVSNGVYTAKINGTAIAYADDKLIEIRHTAATTYQLWYNGSKVGADQTINDAAINNNTLYAQFSTYAGCVFSSFFLTTPA